MNPLTFISQFCKVCGNSGVEQDILALVKQHENTVYVHAQCVTQHGNVYVVIQSKTDCKQLIESLLN